jgi:phage N-6-adenine-methyltransferase
VGDSIAQPLLADEVALLSAHEAQIERGLQTFYEVGAALLAIRDQRLYREGYSTFEAYCRDRWGMSKPRVYQMIEAAGIVDDLKKSTIVDLPINEAQARPLAAVAPDERPAVWREAVETAPNGRVTAAHVQSVVDARREPEPVRIVPDDPAPIPPEPEPQPAPPILDPLNPAVPVSSLPDYDGDEWYTPAYLVEAARVAMGSIDLDPASCETAQAVVQAATFYTKADNGITSPWSGNVWMNPPYSVPQEFTRKAIDEWRAGTIAQAIILVNNCTETEWFHELMQDTACICLLRRRAAFWYPNRRDFGARQGQVVFGIGVDVARFTEAFCSLGIILTEVRHG